MRIFEWCIMNRVWLGEQVIEASAKPQTRNLKPQTQILKPETSNPKPQTQNYKLQKK